MTGATPPPEDKSPAGAPLPGPDPRLERLGSEKPDMPDPKRDPKMTRESALESKEPEKRQPEPQPGDLWAVIKAILGTPWGRRLALVIVGVVLFFTGFIGGHWGKSDLRGQLSDREREIIGYKKEKLRLEQTLAGAERERDQLSLRLRESEAKREFYRQRDKIRRSVMDSKKAWDAQNVKEAMEALHKANIHFQDEARVSRGVSAYLYRTIARRFQAALTAMETGCADTPPPPMGFVELPKPGVPSCQERVGALLQQVLDALPPARED